LSAVDQMVQTYKRPPIVEAVIEIKIEGGIESDVLERVKNQLLEDYPAPPLRTMAVNLELADEPKVRQQAQGYRLSSGDGASLVTIGPGVIATSRLAPYEGWESFNASARRNWSIWGKLTGRRNVTRLGVRYINRIDVPGQHIQVGDYVGFGMVLPEALAPTPLASFALNAAMPLGEDGCKLILNSGSAVSPLVNVTSFILDVDVSCEIGLPQNDDGLWELANRIRRHKNTVFEACVTDRARELFNR
jgi:uncharacterized protein (TIGR04255 family)